MNTMKRLSFCAIVLLALAPGLQAATFIVPSDAELVSKARAIVDGEVLTSYSRYNRDGGIETVNEITVRERIKGPVQPGSIIKVVEMGGSMNDQFLIVPGVPTYRPGDQVLVFLTKNRNREWTTVDLVVGKFRRVDTARGQKALMREEDELFGWDRDGRPHREQVRSAEGFLQFVRAAASGAVLEQNYLLAPSSEGSASESNSTLIESSRAIIEPSAPGGPVKEYTLIGTVQPGDQQVGIRWSSFPTASNFFLKTNVNAPTFGEAAISNGMAAWNSDCGSNVNYTYGGVNAGASAGLVAADSFNGILFNDPNNEIPGTFTGSGTLGLGGIFINAVASFSGETVLNIFQGDVVIQDGVNLSLTGMNELFAHELGHTLGFRHSNQPTPGQQTINTTASIMKAVAAAPIGAVLQPYDMDAVRTVYPGGACLSRKNDFNGDGRSDILFRHNTTGEVWEWHMNGPSILLAGHVFNINDINFKNAGVGDFNGDGRADILYRHSLTGEIWIWTMNGTAISASNFVFRVADPTFAIEGVGDFNGDGRSDILFRSATTGEVWIWFMNGPVISSFNFVFNLSDVNFKIAGVGDFNNDGRSDILFRHLLTGEVWLWRMNGASISSSNFVFTISDVNFKIAGVGDFGGNGNADILFRHSLTGEIWIWQMNANVIASSNFVFTISDANFKIAGNADFNGDGRSDILFRSATTGEVWIWTMNGASISASNFVFTINDVNFVIIAPN